MLGCEVQDAGKHRRMPWRRIRNALAQLTDRRSFASADDSPALVAAATRKSRARPRAGHADNLLLIHFRAASLRILLHMFVKCSI